MHTYVNDATLVCVECFPEDIFRTGRAAMKQVARS